MHALTPCGGDWRQRCACALSALRRLSLRYVSRSAAAAADGAGESNHVVALRYVSWLVPQNSALELAQDPPIVSQRASWTAALENRRPGPLFLATHGLPGQATPDLELPSRRCLPASRLCRQPHPCRSCRRRRSFAIAVVRFVSGC